MPFLIGIECLQLRVDTVQAGLVPNRAVTWTGRRRTEPDRTDLPHGPVCTDRTGGAEARAGPRGPPMARWR